MFHQVSEKDLAKWGGMPLLREAEQVVKRGDVLEGDFSAPWGRGRLKYAGRELGTKFRLISNSMIDSHCPCVINQRNGRICVHVVALGLFLRQEALSPERTKLRDEEKRHALAMQQAEEDGTFFRRERVERGGTPAEIRVRLPQDWFEQFWEGHIHVECEVLMAGSVCDPERLPDNIALALSREDEALLFVLEDICEGAPSKTVVLTRSDFLGLAEVHSLHRRKLYRRGGAPLSLADGLQPVRVILELDEATGELKLTGQLKSCPDGTMPNATAQIVAQGRRGWALLEDGIMYPLEKTLPEPFQEAFYRPVIITRDDVIRFLRQDLPRLAAAVELETEVEFSQFRMVPAEAVFSLRLKGSLASMAATLFVRYAGGHELPAGTAISMGDFGLPDPDDSLCYGVRNLAAEELAVSRLNSLGFAGINGSALEPVVGERAVLNMLGSGVPALRRLGWKIEQEGRLAELSDSLQMAVPVVHVDESDCGGEFSGGGWFDVALDVQAPDGSSIAPAEVQRAVLSGDSFLSYEGETILLDTETLRLLRNVFRDCAVREGAAGGTFRMDAVYAPYVQTSLDALDGVDVEAPQSWRKTAASLNRQSRVEPVALGEPLDGILRPYQRDGVAWLRFLEANGLCGLLADEMGLGKTLQTLAWLQLARLDKRISNGQSLVVCPTSLVENWRREAQQFAPDLKVLTMTGGQRHDAWDQFADYDVVITSYALLRRDIENYRRLPFACMVLDEAQHIKNRTTQNAITTKQVNSQHRLVLTGTPIENSVADLWSIMDFLMPGYLGDYREFRENYEKPIAQPETAEAADAQRRLRRRLHPFMLRRRKREVARDLPEKLVKISYCSLSPDQQKVYENLLHISQERIGSMVEEKGFERSRIEILAILMRLRQTCCHLGLLGEEKLLETAENPSAKMEQFFEILDEAMAGGHRMLVFSQFVRMLSLLRGELEARGIPYSYLDGSTKNRLDVCRRFNRDEDIPLFLISLKAGGTGLNLTGADMVVHFDPWWNPAVEDQATDRAHRIGQKRTVYSIKLITEGTIEEKVLNLQKRKQAIIGATVEGDEQTMGKLSWEDIRELLSA